MKGNALKRHTAVKRTLADFFYVFTKCNRRDHLVVGKGRCPNGKHGLAVSQRGDLNNLCVAASVADHLISLFPVKRDLAIFQKFRTVLRAIAINTRAFLIQMIGAVLLTVKFSAALRAFFHTRTRHRAGRLDLIHPFTLLVLTLTAGSKRGQKQAGEQQGQKKYFQKLIHISLLVFYDSLIKHKNII